MPFVLALPELLVLAALIVALGLIYGGKAFVDALLAIIRKVTKALPFSGLLIGAVAEWALQKLSNKMGELAEQVGSDVSRSWHFLATVIDRTGWAIFHLATAAARLQYYVEVAWPLDQLWKRAQDAYQLAARGLKVSPQTITRTIVQKADLTAFRRWVVAQIAAIPQTVAHAAATAIPLPHSPLGDIAGALGRIRARLGKLERGIVPVVGVGAFAYGLTRLGLGWTRCTNVGKLGRSVCRSDTNLLDSLLAGSLLIVGSISLAEMARDLREPTALVMQGVEGFVRELDRIG